MNVLVTGYDGFIGTNLCKLLTDYGYQIWEQQLFVGHDHLDEIDAVIHLAAISGIEACDAEPGAAYRINVDQTRQLLVAFEGIVPKPRILLASSRAAADISTVYGATKYIVELLAREYRCATAVRIGNVYGPHSLHKTSVVATFCRALLNEEPLRIDGDGEQTRDFQYVEDVCVGLEYFLHTHKSEAMVELPMGVTASVNSIARCLTLTSRGHEDQCDIGRPLHDKLAYTYAWFKGQQ